MSSSSNAPFTRSKATMQHANYRVSVASTAAAAPGGSGSGRSSGVVKHISATGSAVVSPENSQPLAVLWDAKEDTVCDTWSGYLTSQLTKSVTRNSNDGAAKSRSGQQHPYPLTTPAVPHATYLPRSSMLNGLNACIARQNEMWERLRAQATGARRANEARRRQQVEEVKAAGLENTLTATVLQRLLANCQERWQALLTRRIDEAVAAQASENERASSNKAGRGGPSSSGSGGASSDTNEDADNASGPIPITAAPAFPSVEELFCVLVDGLNDSSTRQCIVDEFGIAVDSDGIDSVGLITPFEAHIHALVHWFPSVAPDLKALRQYFEEFDPQYLSCTANKVDALETSLSVAETQLDLLLREGDHVEGLAALLRQSVHPSLRRLVYPRAFAVPLRVTDGKPLFPAEGELTVNDTSGRTIPCFLTCASRHSRDKVRRRSLHSFSTPLQEVRVQALQKMALTDVLIHVGDSDKYFIFQDDCEVINPALVADRGVPVNGLKVALEQLGRGDDTLDAYVVYLRSQEGQVIQQKAPPCGFFPIAGCSLLTAPVANMTGDTVEQYELVSAMFAQLWGRIQGPTPELLQCCLIFERLVTDHALPATLHATRVLQTPPLRLALEWMLTGFAESLDTYEVLILWDWIAACHIKEMYHLSPLSQPVGLAATGSAGGGGGPASPKGCDVPCALWLLPVMAAALFILRAPLILKCRSRLDMEALFVANHHIACRPLLQAFLFTNTLASS